MRCIVCGKEIVQKLYANSKQKYCSLKCKTKDYYNVYYKHFEWKVEKKCLYCGKTFIPNQVRQRYCTITHMKSAWKKKHWDRSLELQREWFKKEREKRPEYFNFFSTNRSAQKRANGGGILKAEWDAKKLEYHFTCPKCGKKEPEIKLSVDHIIPLSKGGKHCIENIQPLCKGCNSSKSDHYTRHYYPLVADNYRFC